MIVLFDGPLTPAFEPSKPFLMNGERITLDFFVENATLEWFLEFTSDDPNKVSARWAREGAEEYTTAGVTHMPVVVRDFPGPGAFSAHFIRAHQFVRIQLRGVEMVPAPDAAALVRSPFGLLAQSQG